MSQIPGLADQKPLVIWCVDDLWHCWQHWREAEQWALDRGLASLNPHSYTWRIEFYLIDVPFAVVYCDDPGHLWADNDRKCAQAEPRMVLLTELPPDHLMEV